MQGNKTLDLSLFCLDTGLIQSWLIFFLRSIFLLLSKTKTDVATRSNHLHLRCVKIHLWRIRSQRCCLENWVLAYVVKNEAQQKQLQNDASHLTTSRSAKNKLNPARNENQPNMQYTPFLLVSLQLSSGVNEKTSHIYNNDFFFWYTMHYYFETIGTPT